MGLFNTLMSKIFNHPSASSGQAATSSTGQTAGGAGAQPFAGGASTSSPSTGASPSASSAPAKSVDVAAVLNDLASKNAEKLDWKHSIVDLMKLVGMDSSLSARKELAKDLNYTGDMNDSAAMNIWLHAEVMRKLAENGGKLPQDLLKK